jgi:hypothetical protein
LITKIICKKLHAPSERKYRGVGRTTILRFF